MFNEFELLNYMFEVSLTMLARSQGSQESSQPGIIHLDTPQSYLYIFQVALKYLRDDKAAFKSDLDNLWPLCEASLQTRSQQPSYHRLSTQVNFDCLD